LLISGPAALSYGIPGTRAATVAGAREVDRRVRRAGTLLRNWRRKS
jgi:hypothetical protein